MRRLGLLALALAAAIGCDSGTPVAPGEARLTISASPQQIGVQGQSVITVTAVRPTGAPVNPGTQIRLSTTLGAIEQTVTTDDQGVARAVLESTGRAGTATVTATSGVAEPASVDVTIGIAATRLTLTASPSTVGTSGGSINLRAVARDDSGEPLAGVPVVFSAELGSLRSGGNVVRTDAGGVATDRLTVTANELATLPDRRLQVRADAGGATATLEIPLVGIPQANFTTQKNGLTVIFTDTSLGVPTSWQWDFGDGFSSTLQNPTHTYGAPGTYTVTLTVSNAEGSSSRSQFVTVP